MNHSPSHDHQHCIDNALDRAQAICLQRGRKFTAIRQRVLTLIWNSHEPISAYDILDLLSENKKRVAPPTVYRALDFLLHEGFIHRIESLNAYVGCSDPEHSHNGYLLICNKCNQVTEILDDLFSDAFKAITERYGHSCEDKIIEISGVCRSCHATA